MQNKGQVDVLHATRERALARGREIVQASKGRFFEQAGDRIVSDPA